MGRRRSYKFTNKQHSKGGVRSSVAAAVSLIATAIAVYGAYLAKGDGERYLIIFGFLAFTACGYGTFAGYRSFQEEECYYLFSRIGTILSLLLLIFWIAIFGIGFVI